MNIQTAEQVFNKNDVRLLDFNDTIKQSMIEFAKLHVKAALEAASKKAKAIDNTYSMGGWGMKGGSVSVSKESILTAYPENLIL